VNLGNDARTVSFFHMCAEFQVVERQAGSEDFPNAKWTNVSQPDNAPWLFKSIVNLQLQSVEFKNLPKEVRDQIKNISESAFSIQQLLFDLDNTALESIPTIIGVEPGSDAYTVLLRDFVGTYFAQMKKGGKPLFGITVTDKKPDPGTLVLTDFNFQVNQYLNPVDKKPFDSPTLEQKDLNTLSYLCATSHHELPPNSNFGWNWVEMTERRDFHGIIAINRNTFATYVKEQTASLFPANCAKAWVRVWLDGRSNPEYDATLTENQTPTTTLEKTGAKVLNVYYHSEYYDEAGLNGALGKMELKSTFNADVTFADKTMTISQSLTINLYAKKLATSTSGDIVKKTLTDTYHFDVNHAGKLEITYTPGTIVDTSDNPSADAFLSMWVGFNTLYDKVKNDLRGLKNTELKNIPVSIVQNFVFPGGKVFAFKDVQFSNNQDLICHITYLDPTS